MYNQQFYVINNILMALDAIIVLATGYFAYLFSIDFRSERLIMAYNDLLILLIVAMFSCNYFMGRFGFYSDKRFQSKVSMINALFFAVLSAFVVMVTVAVMLGIDPFSRLYLVSHFLTVLILFAITRICLHYYLEYRARTSLNSRQILLAGSQERVIAMANALNKQQTWGHKVVGYLNGDVQDNPGPFFIPLLGTMNDFNKTLLKHQIDEVIFVFPQKASLKLDKYIKKCEDIGVTMRIVPAMFDFTNPCLKSETIQGIPTLSNFGEFGSASGLLYKRILDLMAGTIGVLILFVLYPILGFVIKLDSPGPVLFKQRRIGQHGREFFLYKFRSMVSDAESKKTDLLVNKETAWPEYKTGSDPRLTRVGRFLRNTSLDEFPQFINVLKGEMSMVGTRPPTPEEVKNYEDWHRRRISIKPGITGLWQITGRKEITDFYEVVTLDLRYIDGWTFRRDFYIIFKTFWVVLARKGAK